MEDLDPELQKAILNYLEKKNHQVIKKMDKKSLLDLKDDVKHSSSRYKVFKEYPDKFLIMIETVSMGIKINLKTMTPQ